jgi:hypothetical protein
LSQIACDEVFYWVLGKIHEMLIKYEIPLTKEDETVDQQSDIAKLLSKWKASCCTSKAAKTPTNIPPTPQHGNVSSQAS